MCIFGGNKAAPPPLPPPPPQTATVGDADVAKARSDEQNRLRAMSGTGSTMLTNSATLDSTATTGTKTLGG